MSSALAEYLDVTPNVEAIITEDDNPLVNLPSEKQQRLLTETLYSSWAGPGDGRQFLAAANVGVFYLARRPAIVPDMLLCLDVEVPENWWEKEHRSYFLWEFGKPPDLAIEIVSNKEGKEEGEKKTKYAWMRVLYYVLYDPLLQVMPEVLTIYRLEDGGYERQESLRFHNLNLGVELWEGTYEGKQTTWLRWVDGQGVLIPTGRERAESEKQRAESEKQRAESEKQRAESERQRAESERQRAEAAELRESQMTERVQHAEALLEQERQRAKRLEEMLRELGKDPG